MGDSPAQTLERQCHPTGPQKSPSGGGAGGVSGEHDKPQILWEDHLYMVVETRSLSKLTRTLPKHDVFFMQMFTYLRTQWPV